MTPKATDLIEVWQPNGDIAYRADSAERERLLRDKQAKPQYGRDKRLKALRLKVAIPVRTEADNGPVNQDGRHIPVIRMRELLAPSPRRHFGWRNAVYSDMRQHPQRATAGEMRYVRGLDEDRRVRESAVHAERIETRRA